MYTKLEGKQRGERMKYIWMILGWLALIAGLLGLGLQNTQSGYLALILGILCLLVKDIRGMGLTAICFGVVTFLMTTLFN